MLNSIMQASLTHLHFLHKIDFPISFEILTFTLFSTFIHFYEEELILNSHKVVTGRKLFADSILSFHGLNLTICVISAFKSF